jgi:plastocyanin
MKKVIGFIILLIAFVAFTACTQQAELTPAPTTVPTTVMTTVIPTVTRTLSPSTKVVTTFHMRNNAFVPQELTVLPGTGITWINDDDKVHTVKTIGTYAGKFNSGDILPGAQWGYTFGVQEGTYEFNCAYHPEMKGSVIIKKAGTSLIRP